MVSYGLPANTGTASVATGARDQPGFAHTSGGAEDCRTADAHEREGNVLRQFVDRQAGASVGDG